ncbi:hypothetical protein A4A49_16628 [Nicotiana attenuata]|uniref:Uncharacterized protein n=1 Tax=Nicotiana attenuata TaxID=49451 RepID=A0A314KJP5_NICAT|nr:hypothetical protein A4A49_16628 [Nicotiana attenuata]
MNLIHRDFILSCSKPDSRSVCLVREYGLGRLNFVIEALTLVRMDSGSILIEQLDQGKVSLLMCSCVYDLYIVINFVSVFELNCGILFIVSFDPGPNEIGRSLLSFEPTHSQGMRALQ